MEKFRKLFRNPASDLLFVMGLMISCVILINVADLLSRIASEQEATDKFRFTSSSILDGSSINKEQDKYIKNYLVEYIDKIQHGNVYITKSVYIDKRKDERCKALILMEDNESLLLEFKQGGYSKGADYKNAAIIGESLEEYVIENNGASYINIEGELFNVIGILKNNMSADIDKTLYILWDTVEANIKEVLVDSASDDLHNVYYQSNICEPQFIEDLNENLAQYELQFMDFVDVSKGTDNYLNTLYKNVKKIVLSGALVFSILTSFSVSYLWLLNRRQELAVRMSYGYSSWQVFILLFKNTLSLIVPALLISIGVQWIYGLVVGREMLFAEQLYLQILVIFVGIMCIVLINTLYLTKKLKRFSIVMVNEEC